MIHIWAIMVAGERPFRLDSDGGLVLRLQPVLDRPFFLPKPRRIGGLDLPRGSFAFCFLGRTLVVYHNRRRRATFGPKGAGPVAYRLTYTDGTLLEIDGDHLKSGPAGDVREGRVERIDVTLE